MSKREAHAHAMELVHHHPGRVRVRSEAFRKDGSHAATAREAVSGMPGVLSVHHDDRTGSLLIQYEPAAISSEAILQELARSTGLPYRARRLPPGRTPGGHVIEAFRELNAATFELTGYHLDLRTLIPATMGCASLALLIFGDEERLPKWDSLAYWSVNLFVMLHAPQFNAAWIQADAAAAEALAGNTPG